MGGANVRLLIYVTAVEFETSPISSTVSPTTLLGTYRIDRIGSLHVSAMGSVWAVPEEDVFSMYMNELYDARGASRRKRAI